MFGPCFYCAVVVLFSSLAVAGPTVAKFEVFYSSDHL